MKKLLAIVVLGLLLSGNAYALTIYCDAKQWINFLTFQVDLEAKTVRDDIEFGGGKIYNATINEKSIFFNRDGDEHWLISRSSGKFSRKVFSSNINQEGVCSTEKPKYKKKF